MALPLGETRINEKLNARVELEEEGQLFDPGGAAMAGKGGKPGLFRGGREAGGLWRKLAARGLHVPVDPFIDQSDLACQLLRIDVFTASPTSSVTRRRFRSAAGPMNGRAATVEVPNSNAAE